MQVWLEHAEGVHALQCGQRVCECVDVALQHAAAGPWRSRSPALACMTRGRAVLQHARTVCPRGSRVHVNIEIHADRSNRMDRGPHLAVATGAKQLRWCHRVWYHGCSCFIFLMSTRCCHRDTLDSLFRIAATASSTGPKTCSSSLSLNLKPSVSLLHSSERLIASERSPCIPSGVLWSKRA